jgi:two-component system cell cycle response regulator DivK
MTTVLVIDDNPLNLKLAQRVLVTGGHQVLTADSGPQGLALAQVHRPDVVVLDIQMPDIDGFEIARRLKADPATARIRLLALTALAMKGDEERILAAGCDAYLGKPFRYPELLETVARLAR